MMQRLEAWVRSRMDAFRFRLAQWLGLGDLVRLVVEQGHAIDGLRRDQGVDVERIRAATTMLRGVNDRLATYERTVPAILKVKRAMDERARRARPTPEVEGIRIVPNRALGPTADGGERDAG